jgi:aerobic-type carbon monoxide dehydrogenase small subunit (CoxS/CutS family)
VRLRKGEILAAVRLPKNGAGTGSAFLKLSRVRADLAKVNVAVRLVREGDRIADVHIELGSVGPTVLRARQPEVVLLGKGFSKELVLRACGLVADEIRPVDDVRSSADYRRRAAVALTHDGLMLAWERAGTGSAPAAGGEPASSTSQRSSSADARERDATEVTSVPRGEVAVSLRQRVEPIRVGSDETVTISLTVNDERRTLDVRSNELLLNVLRERLELTGTKYGCGIGECGACTVWMNGVPVLACLVLAVSADGANVRTIEGEAVHGELSALQRAFIDENAFQCGFCTPGMLMMTKKLLEEIPQPTEDEIRDYLKGNQCRCTGYASIVRAVQRAALDRPYAQKEAPQELPPEPSETMGKDL